jgi:mono/diheme cytochrome c family protein
MLNKGMILLGTVLMACSVCLAQDKTDTKPVVKKTVIQQTSAASGKGMYTEYCASCHGKDGKGSGPAATALKMSPPDLTVLSKKHDGKFPADKVASTLKFGHDVTAHGSSEMPVWGPLFQSLDKYHDAIVQQRIANVVKYVESLQAK